MRLRKLLQIKKISVLERDKRHQLMNDIKVRWVPTTSGRVTRVYQSSSWLLWVWERLQQQTPAQPYPLYS